MPSIFLCISIHVIHIKKYYTIYHLMHKQSQIKIKHSHTETKGQHMYVVRHNLGVTSTNQLRHVILILKRADYKQQQLCCCTSFDLHFKYSSPSISLPLLLISMNNPFKEKLGLHPMQGSY